MKWEDLTVVDFARALKKTKGVCLLTLSVIEKHGYHLPLGTDMFNVYNMALLAAKREPVVVFPYYYFTQIQECKHKFGTIAIKPNLMFKLLENVCDEIGRNGFKKIIILNGHGGNGNFGPFFVQSLLSKKRDYMVYYVDSVGLLGDDWKKIHQLLKTKIIGHACEFESSVTLATVPHLVKMNYIPNKPAKPLGKLSHLYKTLTAMNWYADYPNIM